MDKQYEESRRQFEERYSNKNPHSRKALEKWGDTPPNSEDYKSLKTQEAWEIWQASRAGIAVEIPETVGYGMINRSEILANLRSIGLSIKGE
ncbi:hypothetical protein [Serratia ureilytica]|uniref:hypothetical protein n=1 Tax=Serratia ureilytica TaxID=300181 RepID=UPI0018D7DEDB|nr:hypothetical protein [Serratia ureilytica]MBH3006779.1 hypothetical protein [Serratia ureilytica]